ncbi:MAG: amidohydrolase family protein [Actinomycetota bacterium]
MKNGYRIVDTDTHVVPAMELLLEHASDELRRRWDELKPYMILQERLRTDLGDYDKPYLALNVAPWKFDRPLGGKTGEEGNWRKKLGDAVKKLENGPEIGTWHDNPSGRLRAMDREGADRHLLIPGTFAMASTALDASLSVELLGAYNRYIAWYCEADPDRLKASIQVSGADPEWSAGEVKRWSNERCVAAVTVNLPQDLPVDDPDLHPIWSAMDEADLPMLHHSFFFEPPYFPGYRDIWGNAVAARAAAHPWGAQRLVAYLVLSGLFDRFPRLRVGFAEVGAGWLPFWLYRLQGQVDYMRAAIPDMKKEVLQYAAEGQIYVGLEFYEAEPLAKSIIDVLGEDVLMWQSDFPHPQCNFPNSPDLALSWTTISESAKRKLMAENAERYLRII